MKKLHCEMCGNVSERATDPAWFMVRIGSADDQFPSQVDMWEWHFCSWSCAQGYVAQTTLAFGASGWKTEASI